MNLIYTEDTDVGAAYLSLDAPFGDVARTVSYEQDKNLDFDADGNIVGIEFLSLPPVIDVSGLRDYVKLGLTEILMIQYFLARFIA